jgi:hypothetical protein
MIVTLLWGLHTGHQTVHIGEMEREKERGREGEREREQERGRYGKACNELDT